MGAKYSSETSFGFQRITVHYIPEDRFLHNHHWENLKYYIIFVVVYILREQMNKLGDCSRNNLSTFPCNFTKFAKLKFYSYVTIRAAFSSCFGQMFQSCKRFPGYASLGLFKFELTYIFVRIRHIFQVSLFSTRRKHAQTSMYAYVHIL
jgi:hypothetical protein